MARQQGKTSGYLRQMAVALGYVGIYAIQEALYPLMHGHSFYSGGFRLAFLLLTPYRYWPALIITDVGCRIFDLQEGDNFRKTGVGFCVTLLFAMLVATPIVWWCRERLALFPPKKLVNFRTLLICVTLVSLLWSLLGYVSGRLALAVVKLPVDRYSVLNQYVSFYMQMLAVIPWALMIRAELQSGEPFRNRLREFSKQLFAADTLLLLLSGALFLIWLIHNNQGDSQHISLMAVFLPIAWLLFKPGWRAAAFGSTPAIVYIGSLVQVGYEKHSFEARTFLALSITCILALGVRIAVQRQRDEQEYFENEEAIRMARQSIQLGEMRMRKTARALELAGHALHLTQHQLLDRFNNVMSPDEAQRYYRQAAVTQKQVSRLADSMYPSAWRERGLAAALRETIADALREVGLAYQCRIDGCVLDDITPAMHAAVYRLACETVAYVNAQVICSSIRLTLRSGVTNNVYWVALRVAGVLETATVNDPIYNLNERDHLAAKLGAHGLGFVALRNHARLFDGGVRERSTPEGLTLIYLLIDVTDRSSRSLSLSTVTQPWVT